MNSLYFKTDISELNDVLSVEMVDYFRKRKKLFDEDKVEKLKKYLKAHTGYAFSSDLWKKKYKENLSEKYIPVLKISNIKSKIKNYIGFDYIDINSLSTSTSKLVELKRNDIVIAMSGSTVGKYGIIETNQKCFVNQRVLVLRVKDNVELLSEYLKLLINVCTEDIIARATGLGLKNINKDDYLNYKAYIPTLKEQKKVMPLINTRINNIENEINRLEEKLKKNTLKNVIDYLFKEEFGLEVETKNSSKYFSQSFKKCNDYLDYNFNNLSINNKKVEFIQLKEILKSGKDKKISSNIKNRKIVGLKDIEPFSGHIINKDKLSNGDINSKKVCFENNDLMFSKMRPYLGKYIFVNDENEEFVGSSELFSLKIKSEKIKDKLIIKYFLSSEFVISQYKMFQTGNNKPRITRENFLKIKIPKKLIDQQISFINKVKNILKNSKKIKAKIDKMKNILKNDIEKLILNGYSNDLLTLPENKEVLNEQI